VPPRRNAEFVLKEFTSSPAEAWDLTVDLMDWNRVLLEATTRHLSLNHGAKESLYDMESHICGECVAEALKTYYTYPSWLTDLDSKEELKEKREKL
jgi:hypothetical protein